MSNQSVQRQFIKKYLNPKVKDALDKELEDITYEYVDEFEDTARSRRVSAAQKIQNELNTFERAYPRHDPILRGLHTDKWVAFIYLNPVKRRANGRFDFKYRIVCLNLQKPFPYRLPHGRKPNVHKFGVDKISTRARGFVGNLAAVRLATVGNPVYPTYARRIVFYIGNNQYAFRTVRAYNIGGHDWYRDNIQRIIDEEDKKGFTDLL